MNHLGDTNKMVSDTPRTDAVNQYLRTRRDYTKTDHEVCMKHGMELERELNAANQRIKRLEEAGDKMEAIIGPPGSAHWADEDQVDAAWNNWRKAREAKP